MDWLALLPILLIALCALVLMVLEALLPTAGILGLIGAGLIALSAWLSLRSFGWAAAIALVIVCVILSLLLFRIVLRSMKQGRLSRSGLFMNEEASSPVSIPKNLVEVGAMGRAVTALRPTGVMDVNGERLRVTTEGTFVEAGATVVVRRTEGSHIVVEPV